MRYATIIDIILFATAFAVGGLMVFALTTIAGSL
jgi:hypothetical protein